MRGASSPIRAEGCLLFCPCAKQWLELKGVRSEVQRSRGEIGRELLLLAWQAIVRRLPVLMAVGGAHEPQLEES